MLSNTQEVKDSLKFRKAINLINLIKSQRNIQSKSFIILYNLIIIIIYIYIIHKSLNTLLLSNMASSLIEHFIKKQKSDKIQKYLKRFNYIFFNKNEYYNCFKFMNYLHEIPIDKIAILNLYIIAQLKSKKGIYLLIKYLNI
uniref:Uncharacterized protein n=1 Tax=Chondria tumulosa TaxID=2740715 RepID=A0A896SVJ8_9FLOR|nr:hypothetical protein K8K75_pgp008 [Chondria tumulosa]QSD57199.1 hypothetical protein [Chondria tumulosa]